MRVPHAPLSELPLSPAAELAILSRVPEGLGARPIAALEPGPGQRWACVVTTRVPGRVLPAGAWADEELLRAHARALAHLHAEGDAAGMSVPERIDPVAAAETAMAWWREHEPGAACLLAEQWPGVLRLLEDRRSSFGDCATALLHGDPAAANTLVDRDGTVRFVDWEWAQVGDVARDLAFIGGEIAAEPWYAPLPEALVRVHTEAYCAARAERGTVLDVELLERRRLAHLVHECFFTSAHLARVARGPGPRAERAGITGERLRAHIADLLA